MNYTIETIWIKSPNGRVKLFQPSHGTDILGNDDLADAYYQAQVIGGSAYAILADDYDNMSRAGIAEGGELVNHEQAVVMVSYEDVF